MDMIIQLILPSLLLPLALSVGMLVWSRSDPDMLLTLPLIWLPSSFWLLGLPDPFPPQEASQWLWVLVLISTTINLCLAGRAQSARYFQAGLVVLATLIISWPVLHSGSGWEFYIELIALAVVAGTLLLSINRAEPVAPALILSICAGGLALVASLGGSVLVGQLSAAMASALGAFALYEMITRLTRSKLASTRMSPWLVLYFALLLIARVYAEIPLFSAAMLLVAPTALVTRHRYRIAGVLVAIGLSLGWLLMTADSSSYY